jgi:putative membrane protein
LKHDVSDKTDNAIGSMIEVQNGCERILHTPLPLAYRISIAQITWVYIIMLPFQLVGVLKWVTIPATIIAAYIILGILLIGSELENPFGLDVNDLPLDIFCEAIADDIEIMTSKKKPKMEDLVKNPRNRMFFPLHEEGYNVLAEKSIDDIRHELARRPEENLQARKRAAAVAYGTEKKDQEEHAARVDSRV